MPDRKTLMESEKAGEDAQTQAVRRGRCAEALAEGSSECSDKDTGCQVPCSSVIREDAVSDRGCMP